MTRCSAPLLGHVPESVIFDCTWSIVCSCGWECRYSSEEEWAWETFNDHIFDEVKTAVTRMRDAAEIRRITEGTAT